MLHAPLPLRRHKYDSRRSSALIIVLCCLVLLTALVVAFFASIATERQSAKIYANSASVKLLADSVIDIVMGQIKGGTRGTDSSGGTLAWASQPGMIRTYNTSGLPAGYYKLYSWANMVGTGGFSTNASEIPPPDWTNMPALYNDLNDPVDGVYPIVNPAATNSVAGFSIDSTAPASTRDASPMPVQWLYVLQDGSLATATGVDGNTVTVASATPANPIVARVAFWTDDDTCKVNINTAGGDIWPTNYPSPGQPGNPGSFWDTPRTDSSFEQNYLALRQPVHGEFQRYPGHPATTYLTAVFPGLSTNQLYAITPRVNGGGSESGTLPVSADAPLPTKTDRLYASVDELLFSTNRTANVPLSNTQVQSANFFLTAHSRAPEVNLFNEPRIVTWPVNTTNSASCRTAYDSLLAFCGTLNNNTYYFQRANSIDANNDLPATGAATGLGRNRELIQYLQNLTSLPVPGFSTNGETFLSKYPGGVATSATDRDQILTETFDYIRALNEQDASSPLMTNSFTPTTNMVNMQGLPFQSGQITPIYDTVTQTRGFGRFPTVTEAGLLFIGIGQTTTSHMTNFPPYALNNFLYTNYTGSPQTYATETWSPPPPASNYMEAPVVGSPGSATNSPPDMTRVQPALVANLFDPSMGLASECPDYFIEVDGLSSFKWKDSTGVTYPMFRQDSTTNQVKGIYNQFGGYLGIRAFTDTDNGYGPNNTYNADSYVINGNSGLGYSYPNYGTTLDLLTGAASGHAVTFLGGTATFKFRTALVNGDWNAGNVGPVIQQVTITFPAFNCPVPGVSAYLTGVPWLSGTINKDFRDIANRFSNIGGGASDTWLTANDSYRSMVLDATKADGRTVAALSNVPSSYFIEGPNYTKTAVAMGGHGIVEDNKYPYYGAFFGSLVPGVSYTTNATLTNTTLGCQTNGLVYTGATNNLQPIANGADGMSVSCSIPVVFNSGSSGAVGANGVFLGGSGSIPGDWDTGTAFVPDGAYINKADEGDIQSPLNNNYAVTPYFNVPQYSTYMISSNFFTPNRQMPSPVMFGSLPTGVQAQRPWQTLLFHPDPGGHLGASSPADHLYLDLFTMPVVEPYPISDPFSTAGKVNMNYQILPFTYITRSTGIQAVLRPEQILAIPTSDGTTYKTASAVNRRYYLDMAQTLQGFTQRFAANDIFRSASEICTIWLVPAGLGQTYSTMQAFWNTTTGSANGALTGDNVRERPYANIYARLTTKSNTFTVHYHVETLKKIKSISATQWVEGTDIVTGDYRGSTTLERYLDTSDTTIPDYATTAQPLAAGLSIDNFYKFRVIETKQFNP